MKKILVLFANAWDRHEFASPRFAGRYRFLYAGFDLSRFPQNLQLLSFDVHRFVERTVARYRRERLDGVLSTDEHFGVMIAAVIARRLGLPGAAPEAVLLAQHKYYGRVAQQRVAPEATPGFIRFSSALGQVRDLALPFPLFVKPVKATYSILARRVDTLAELQRHLTFKPVEKLILRSLLRPFRQLSEECAPERQARRNGVGDLIGEEVLSGEQVTVEGCAYDGNVELIGIVDSIMYPGTCAFQRFEYPSRLPAPVQQRMLELARKLVRGIGFEHGVFNVEMFYQPADDSLKIIEFNPRLAYQFADLYEKVDGSNSYDALLSLTVGERPLLRRSAGAYRNAASFVLRAFERFRLKSAPDRARLEALRTRYRDARLMVYVRRGASVELEMKWLGSYRYAVLNLGAMNLADLFERFHALRSELAFDFA